MKDAHEPVDAFLRAAEIGKRCSNDTLNGRIYGQLASLFAFQRLYHESMEATQQAYKYNLACHNYKGMAFGLMGHGTHIRYKQPKRQCGNLLPGKHTH